MLLVLLLAVVGETFRITITLFYARDVIGIANVGSLYLIYFGVGLSKFLMKSLSNNSSIKH